MKNSAASRLKKNRQRRTLLSLSLIALVYPILRFIGFEVPRKPVQIPINKQLPASGVLVQGNHILIERDNKSWALTRKCTHLGCKVNYHEQGDYLECPCHQSRFSIEGKVTNGPAKENLTIYPVEKRDTAPYYIIST